MSYAVAKNVVEFSVRKPKAKISSNSNSVRTTGYKAEMEQKRLLHIFNSKCYCFPPKGTREKYFFPIFF